MRKLAPHPGGGKHSWQFLRNVTLTDVRNHRDGSSSISVRYRAEYKCECGVRKIGIQP
jgi:hypothetical protein